MPNRDIVPRPARGEWIGRKFGSLTVLARSGSNAAGSVWLCACDCGGQKRVSLGDMRTGHTTSCGCQSRPTGEWNITHGKSRTRTYRIWAGMRKRCLDPGCDGYAKYGAVGITVCERWATFTVFLADMGEAPAGTSLDRFPAQGGNYEPHNCRWATASQQQRNKQNNRMIEIDGVTRTLAEWAEYSDATYKAVHRRLKRGWSARNAIFGRAK